MSEKEKRSLGLRLLNSLCAFAIIGAAIYTFVAGFQLAVVGVAALALAGVAVPAAASADGILEVFVGIFEAIIDGVVGVFEAILGFFSSLFG